MSAGEWFEDSAFWEIYAPLMFDEARWAEVPETVSRIETFAEPGGGKRLLDLCCGVGRHCLEFARRG
ncbi:MAG TPA: class I SAM-dependent methyltransferase, partial [Rectinemataceae bacterium]